MNQHILDGIKGPEDIKKLNINELNELCSEIREYLLKTVSENGGHLASNMGVVELTVAIHKAFNSPTDKIIFDVGHQCYTHKLLTGRYSNFSTLRKKDGISGFMRPNESEHDPVITGHSSTSISSAYGILKGNSIQNIDGYSVVVIGDGAMTGGMVYEAFNNAGRDRSKLIVILNDNKMSISKNVGSFARHLNLIRSKPKYVKFKNRLENVLLEIPVVGKRLRNSLFRSKTLLKNVIYKSNLFEELGFRYLGPVNGHNIEEISDALETAKTYNRPVIIHAITKKGKGYKLAERYPSAYHGVSHFDLSKGCNSIIKPDFSKVICDILVRLAQKDEKICVVTAAMQNGTGMDEFAKKYHNRFFDVGIAEEHAITFSAGLAVSGMKPVFAVYSSFLQRGYDQLIHDAAIANLHLTVLVDRAGFVGADGETHQGLFDVAFLLSIPNVTVYSPATYNELELIVKKVLNEKQGVNIIRYPKGVQPNFPEDYTPTLNSYSSFIKSNSKTAVVTYGTLTAELIEAQKALSIDIYKLNTLNDVELLCSEKLINYNSVFCFEEAIENGSVGQRIGASLMKLSYKGKYEFHGVSGFVPAMTIAEAKKEFGLDSESIIKTIKEDLN